MVRREDDYKGLHYHAEQSEASSSPSREILCFAQDDKWGNQ